MLAIQGIYDGKQIKIPPCEKLPEVNQDVAVVVLFFEDILSMNSLRTETAKRMREQRDKMPPLGISVKELIEAGREH